MENWEEFKLSEVCNFNKNSINLMDNVLYYLYSFQAFDNNKMPEISLGNNIKSNKYIVEKNSILFNKLNVRFKRVWNIDKIKINSICSTEFIPIKCNDNRIYKNFLYYFLITDKITKIMDANKNGTSGSHQRIKPEVLYNLKIKLPPLEEQKAIANTLSCLDEKIELNNKINKNLEEMAQAIFKKWFIDFDYPLTEEEIANGGREFVDSELGKIPKGWSVGNLGKSTITNMIKSGINNFVGEKTYLATADVENTNIVNTNTKITLNEKPSRANMQPKSKTVWFAKMKDSRKLIFVDDYSKDLIDNYIFSTGFAGIECFNNSLYYVWAYLLTNEFDIIKNNLCNGTTMQAINNENINKIDILIPTIEVLKLLEDISLPIFKKWYINNKQNEKLTQIRDALLPKLINGDIRVPY